jgi:hypothetical protein
VASNPQLRTYLKLKNLCIFFSGQSSEIAFCAIALCFAPGLRIETGRFSGTSPTMRSCKLCNLNVCEDEIHFICTVHALDSRRRDKRSFVR